MQPMLHLGLQIEQAALVAPGLDFINSRMIDLRDAEPDKTKSVLGKSRVTEPEFFAALGRQIRNDLAIQEFGEREFRIWISGDGRGRSRFRCDRSRRRWNWRGRLRNCFGRFCFGCCRIRRGR